MRAVLPDSGGEDDLAGSATGVVGGGDLRIGRHRVHRDGHRNASALAACIAVARHVVGCALAQLGLVSETALEGFAAGFSIVPTASVAVAALGDTQAEGAGTAARQGGGSDLRVAGSRVHRHSQRDGAVTSLGIGLVDGEGASVVDFRTEIIVRKLVAAQRERLAGCGAVFHRDVVGHGAVATVLALQMFRVGLTGGVGRALPYKLVANDGVECLVEAVVDGQV